jgi:hypothetical protein
VSRLFLQSQIVSVPNSYTTEPSLIPLLPSYTQTVSLVSTKSVNLPLHAALTTRHSTIPCKMTALGKYIHTYFGVDKENLIKISTFFKPLFLKKGNFFSGQASITTGLALCGRALSGVCTCRQQGRNQMDLLQRVFCCRSVELYF